MASKSLGTLTIDLIAKIGGFEQGMDRASKTAKKRLAEIEQNAKVVGAAIGAAMTAAATAASVAIKAAIDNADALDEMAQRTGIAVETLSRLQVAAKFGAVSMEDLQKAIGRLAVQQQNYAEGNADTVALFDALGVKAVDSQGRLRDVESVLVDLADAFASLPDGAQKTALAMDLLGKSGQNLIPFLNQGSDRIRELNEAADRLGITLSGDTAQAAGQFNDQLDLARFAVQGLAAQVASDLLPDLLDLVTGFNDAATAGDRVSATAGEIADGIRVIADIAVRAKDIVRGFSLAVVSAFDFAAAAAASAFGQYADMQELLDRSGAARDLANSSLDAAFGSRAPGVNRPGGPVQFIDPPASGPAQPTVEQNARLEEYAQRRERAASASAAQAAADRAAAEAARELERAEAELARRLEEMAQQQADFNAGLDDLEAQLSGPLAEAELAWERRGKELQRLLDEGVITIEEATRAQMLYAQEIAKTRDQLDPLGEQYRLLLEDMAFEYDLLGKTNAQRVAENELRRLGIDLMTEEGQAAAAAIETQVEAYEARQRTISAMDEFRANFADNVAAVLDGTKSVKDALKDMVDDFIAQLARMAAQNFAESLFGNFGTNQTGSAGGWLSALFGAFGGARAAGGPVMAGVPYLVGEQGPELVIPKSSGTVIPAGQTQRMLGGRQTVVNNFNMPGRYDLRTQAQVAAEVQRAGQRSLARGTA